MGSLQILSFFDLSIAFIPVVIVIGIIYKWSLNTKNAIYAISRMLAQLLLIGYFLAYIFKSDSALLILLLLILMIFISSWIALGVVKTRRFELYRYALLSIAVGGGITLLVMSQGVVHIEPWYLPQYIIPLAGMIFANAMNCVSLSAERLFAEMDRGAAYKKARNIAFQTSLIPITNSLFAVGLVSIPGMMTGQILSGVEPYIAARYQIMVMCMIFGSAGISSALFLMLLNPEKS
jgi:putative ABC transport system permease protein